MPRKKSTTKRPKSRIEELSSKRCKPPRPNWQTILRNDVKAELAELRRRFQAGETVEISALPLAKEICLAYPEITICPKYLAGWLKE